MQRALPALLVLACVQNPALVPAGENDRAVDAATASAEATQVVRPGIEVFVSDVPATLRGRRVGLITNHSAIDRARNLDIDLMAQHKDLKLVALFAPEHGIRGDAPAGLKILDEKDPKTGVPVYSLYMSEDRGPSQEMLRDVDVLVYDLQEVGGRTWTYVSTMALSMEAAKRKGFPSSSSTAPSRLVEKSSKVRDRSTSRGPTSRREGERTVLSSKSGRHG